MPKNERESLICTSLGANTLQELAGKALLARSLGSDLVELRIDRLVKPPSERELRQKLASIAEKAVFTVRSSREGGGFRGGEARRLELISSLAELKPAYIDVELATAKENPRWLKAVSRDVRTIVSWHDFKGTPTLALLRSVCKEELALGAVAKVVTTAKRAEDNIATLTLCGDRPGRIVAFCMGELGAVSRVVSMGMGAPLVYASLPNEALAPGQLSLPIMRALREMVV